MKNAMSTRLKGYNVSPNADYQDARIEWYLG